MRRLLPVVACLLLLVPASAEFGPEDDNGWPLTVDGTSTDPFRLQPFNQVGDATLFPYWPMLTVEVQRLADEHPDKVRLHSAGTSTLGLDLWMLEFADFEALAEMEAAGSGSGPAGQRQEFADDALEAGEALPLEAREVVWVDGGTHSNEYSGVYFTLAVAQWLAESDNETATWILENRHTWIMPMVNPDGANAMGRLNANGVNINRNYPVIWDGDGHDPLLNNRGPSPASEVETKINIEWFGKVRPDYYASIHCCGNLWLYPYGEEGVDPVDQDMLQRVCDEAFPAVRDDCGPIWSTIYPASGSSVDTAYEHTGAVSFGYEMSGRGAVSFWGQPVTFDDVFAQERESWAGLLHAFLNVHLYGGHPMVDAVVATGDGHQVTLTNIGYGNMSGMAHIGDAVVDFGPIASGATTTLHIPSSTYEADHLLLHYEKRLMQTPQGEMRIPLTAPVQETPSQESPVPTAGIVVVLLATLALLVVRRRGHR